MNDTAKAVDTPEESAPKDPEIARSDATLAAVVSDALAVQPTASAATLADAAKQTFLWHAHSYVSESIRFADTKAGFAGSVAGALLAGLYGARVHVLSVPLSDWNVAAWLTFGAGVFLIASIGLAAWTVTPRTKSSQTKSFIYWQAISAHACQEQFQSDFAKASLLSLNEQLVQHLYDLSTKICVPKFRIVRLCLLCLCIGALLTIVVLFTGTRP
jgi:hypothetical protein